MDHAAVMEKSRPKGLTILCLLSMAGILLKIGFSVVELTKNHNDFDLALLKFSSLFSENSRDILKIVEYTQQNALTVLITNVVVLTGIIMMWNLKKAGFGVYLAGQLASFAIPFWFLGWYNYFGFALVDNVSEAPIYVTYKIVVIATAITFILLYYLQMKKL